MALKDGTCHMKHKSQAFHFANLPQCQFVMTLISVITF